MGITGLIPFVKTGGAESAVREGHISEFRGKRAGVDVYAWIHKAVYTCAFDLFIGKPTTKYIDFCMRQIKILTDHGVVPVLVFDGCDMPFKVVDEKRRQERESAKLQAKDLIASGNQSAAFKHIVKALDVTHSMAAEVIKAARKINVDCIVAPYEADAQLAYLLKEKYIDIVITEDSDLIVFGCERIFFKMTPTGDGEIYDKNKLAAACTRPNIRFREFSFEKFRHAAIMSGCDYVKNLPGIGLSKAWKFMNTTQITDIRLFVKKIAPYLKMRITVDDQYIRDFIMADLSFQHQYVFDPVKLQRLPYNPIEVYNDDIKEFTHSFKAVDVNHVDLALGNVDIYAKVYDNFRVGSVPLNSIFRKNSVAMTTVEPPKKEEPVHFPEIRVGTKRRKVQEPLQEVAPESDDEELINIYRNSNSNNTEKCEKQETVSVPEPELKKPRKCKFVKSKAESGPEATSKYFTEHNKENVVEDTNVDKISEQKPELKTDCDHVVPTYKFETETPPSNTEKSESNSSPFDPINMCETVISDTNSTTSEESESPKKAMPPRESLAKKDEKVIKTIIVKNKRLTKPGTKQPSILHFFKKN